MKPKNQWRQRVLAWLLATPAVAFAADPQIASFVDSPDPVVAGASYSYTIRVDNNAQDAATNTRLRVVVAGGASFVSANPASQNCSLISPSTVECELGTLGGSGADSRTVTLTWRALGPGLATIDATAELSSDADTNLANNRQSQTTTVLMGANLALSMSDSPDPVPGGGLVTYTLTPTNAGPNSADALIITNNLPPSSSFVSASGSGWACTAIGQTVTCTRSATHVPNASIPGLQIVARATAASGTITNSATIATAPGGAGEPDATDNTATADTLLVEGTDILLADKAVTSTAPYLAGASVSFRIRPRNNGPLVANNVSVTDVFPAGWVPVSAAGPNWNCNVVAQTVTCTRAALPVGSQDDIEIVASAPAPGNVAASGTLYTNTAVIQTTSNDANPANNSASANIFIIRDGADLSLSKTKTPNPVTVGANLSSTIIVTNRGPRVATGPLRVIDALSNETYVNATGSGWSCAPSGSIVVCDHANPAGLAVNGSLPVLTIVTTATSPGTVSNVACTGGTVPPGVSGASARPPVEGDPNASNDCARVDNAAATDGPDLAITATTTTPLGGDKIVSTAENTATYTVVVRNASATAQTATGVRIDIVIPHFLNGQTTVAPWAPVVSAGSSASFACTTLDNFIRCRQNGGTLEPGQTVTITLQAARPMDYGDGQIIAWVTNTVERDLNPANNEATDPVRVEPLTDLEMTGKTITPDNIRGGETATYVLSYRNNGPGPAWDVIVRDRFDFPVGDAGLTVISIQSSKPGSSCSIVPGSQLAPGNDSFSCSIGYLFPNQAETVTLTVRANSQTSSSPRVLPNTATVATTSRESPGGSDNGNNSKAATLTIRPDDIDLLVNTTDAVDPVPYIPGATFLDYRVRVTSNGPSYGTQVRVTETMTPPAGKRVRFVCDTQALGSGVCNTSSLCSSTDVTSAPGSAIPAFSCRVPAGDATTGSNVGDLASGQSKEIYLRFQVLDQPPGAGDVFGLTSVVTSNENDTFAPNNALMETTTTRQRIDIRVTKTASQPSVTVGQPFVWTVNVVNQGPGDSLQTDLTDTLPAGTVVTGPIMWTRTVQPASGNCSLSGLSVSCALGRLDATGRATITIPVRLTASPPSLAVTNTATVDVDPGKTGADDYPGGNNTGTATVTVTGGTLSGTVFEDRDRAGVAAGTPQSVVAEPRLGQVQITLTGTDAFGSPVSSSTLTDADGNYQFTNLPPSDATGYTLEQTQPTTHVNGPADPPTSGADAPSQGGTYSRPALNGNSRYTGIVLAPGLSGVRYNFPELRRPSLSGVVYVDVDNNGAHSPGSDVAIAGATVRLLDANTGNPVATTTTDAAGAYRFTALDPTLSYTLEQPLPTAPTGLANGPVTAGTIGGLPCAAGCVVQPDTPAGGTDRIAQLDLSTGADAAQFNFGERLTSGIGGTVYIDRDRDGQPDPTPADGRISGVNLTLFAGSSCSGTVVGTTLSDANGNYLFGGVTAGQTYTICETQPLGYGDAAPNPGTNGTSTAPNSITITNLPPTGSQGNNFGERVGSISGWVFLDAQNDGTRQPTDAAIPGVTVTLTGTDAAGQTISRTATSDATGAFRFDDLLASPAGYTLTQQAAQPVVAGTATLNGATRPGTVLGSPTGAGTAVTQVPSTISGIALTAGADSTDNLFAEILPVSVRGLVFLDADNNGQQNLPADTPLTGVRIVISGTDDVSTVTRNLTTAADGSFVAADLRPGTYRITEPDQPTGTRNGTTTPGSAGGTATSVATTPSEISAVVLTTPGAQSTANLFAEIALAQLGGRVWLDNNNNGSIDASEAGLPGVTVVLSGTDDLGARVDLNAVTAADGSYRFTGLRPGTYTVTEPAQPADTTNGQTIAGTRGGTASTPAQLPSAVSGIVLAAGQSANDYNFGEIADSADLRVSKMHQPAVLTVGRTAIYRITVRNAGTRATVGTYTVDDRLPAGLSLRVRPTGTGWTCTGNPGDTQFSCSSSAVLAAGVASANTIDAEILVGEAAAAATPVNNAVMVQGGGEVEWRQPSAAERAAFAGAPATLPVCDPAVAHNACRDPAAVQRPASIAGTVWLDNGTSTRQLDGADRRLAGWTVQVTDPTSGQVVAQAVTASDGRYRITNLDPGVELAVRFRAPASSVMFGYPVNGESGPGTSGAACVAGLPAAGTASSCVVRLPEPHLRVVLVPGTELPQQSLPVDPSGVVYDAEARSPVPGAVVSLTPSGSCAGWDPRSALVGATAGGYTIDGGRISMVTGDDGFYQFLMSPSAPSSCTFRLAVTPPSRYAFESALIPPTPGTLQPSGSASDVYAVQPQATAPTAQPGPDTRYHLLLVAGSDVAHVVHNHLPVDPIHPVIMSLTKTGDRSAAEIGDSVRYTLTLAQTSGRLTVQNTLVDRLPAGFTYIPGTASVNGQAVADPGGAPGPTLAFQLGAMPAGRSLVLRYRVRVGVGAAQGDGINRAQGHACNSAASCVDGNYLPLPGSVPTNPAQFQVRVSGGVFGADACVLGKVFVDCNRNHVQDAEELGIPGVRLVLSDGTLLISDSEGKYSLCGLTPKSHVLRIDPATVPRGSRLTTSSNRNLADAGSLWLDLKNGELHRADFIEGSCSNTVLEQVKARRAQGEVRAPETEKKGGPALRFDSKAHQLDTLRSPQQGTDGANQQAPKPRPTSPTPSGPTQDETNVPTPQLPMNRPPPRGRDPGQAADAPNSGDSSKGGSHGTR